MTLDWPIIILCAVGISILLTLVLIPGIIHVSLAKKLFDRPGGRKVHNGVVPRLGGFAFLPVIVMTLGATLIMPAAYTGSDSVVGSNDFIVSLPDIIVMLAAMTIMFLTGLYDDLVGLKYVMKFVAQLLCAVMLVEAGLYITDFNDLFGVSHVSTALAKIITGFLIIYVINGLNLIDGIDGLASGLCVVCLCFFGWILFVEQHFMFSLLSWVGAAGMFVFWFFNVFGSKKKHSKIFMGDIGSLSVGLFLAFMLIAVGRQPQVSSAWYMRPMVLALSPLVIPLFDVVRVFFVRIIHGKSPFLPDKRHIHHLMLAAGMPMKGAMAVLVMAQIAILAINLWLAEFMGINVVLIIDVAIYVAGVLTLKWMKK